MAASVMNSEVLNDPLFETLEGFPQVFFRKLKKLEIMFSFTRTLRRTLFLLLDLPGRAVMVSSWSSKEKKSDRKSNLYCSCYNMTFIF